MPSRWKWQAKDKNGEIIETAPGMKSFDSRGPVSKLEMAKAAKQILDDLRRRAIFDALELRENEWIALEGQAKAAKRQEIAEAADPGYRLVEESIEPLEEINTPLGEFFPKDRLPIDYDKLTKPVSVTPSDSSTAARRLAPSAPRPPSPT